MSLGDAEPFGMVVHRGVTIAGSLDLHLRLVATLHP